MVKITWHNEVKLSDEEYNEIAEKVRYIVAKDIESDSKLGGYLTDKILIGILEGRIDAIIEAKRMALFEEVKIMLRNELRNENRRKALENEKGEKNGSQR